MRSRKHWLALLAAAILLCVISTTVFLQQVFFSPSIKTTSKLQTSTGISGASPTAHVSPSATQTRMDLVAHQPVPTRTASINTPKATSTAINSAPTPTTPPSTGTGATPGWTLIYSDDFTGTQLNPTWGTYNGPHAGGQSYYDPNEIRVQDGLLHISMERKMMGGLPYTTGGLAAFGLAQTYGKYEFRVRLPHGKGVGPYAILWPKDSAPNTAQVDIFESPPVNKDTLYFTNHGTDGSSTQLTAKGNFADDFHVITCEWTPGKLQFLVDGVSQGILTQSIFTQPMWLGLAVSSGDGFTGLPDSTTLLPVSLDVDWVRIYKYNG